MAEAYSNIFTEHWATVEAKVNAAWEFACKVSPNVFTQVATLSLYNALFAPHTFTDEQYYTDFPDTIRAPLARTLDIANPPPGVTEFTTHIFRASLGKTSLEGVMFPGARQQIEQLHHENMPTIIWTTGEPIVQYHKIQGCGLATPQTEQTLGPSSFQPPESILHLQGIVAENKRSASEMLRLSWLIRKSYPVVVEDRIENILPGAGNNDASFLEAFPQATAIWVLQGRRAAKAYRQYLKGERPDISAALERGQLKILPRISELTEMLNQLPQRQDKQKDTQITLILDLDDTILDRDKYVTFRTASIMQELMKHNWVTPVG